MARADLDQRRKFPAARLRIAEAAARQEPASRRIRAQVRRLALDGDQLFLDRLVQPRHRVKQAQRVGVHRVAIDFPRGRPLDNAPRIHDVHPVGIAGHDAQVVRDENHRGPVLLAELLHQLQNLGLDGDVQCGRRLVGQYQVGVADQRHGDHHPLTHAPTELVWILAEAALRIRNAHLRQHLHSPLAGGFLGQTDVGFHGLGQLALDGEHGVERGHRLLEDHGYFLAANLTHLLRIHAEQVLPAVKHLPLGDPARWPGNESHDRKRGHRFAAAALPHHRQRFALVDAVGHAIHGLDHAALGVETRVQIPDFQ